MKLNKAQLEAVNHKSGPLLIIAGAGTGKTAVITERILKIVNEGWADPSEILALTFTEKAAGEMEERIDMSMPYGYEQMWISTFHSFCDRLLKQEGVYMGLDTNYKLMTQAESYIFFRQHLFEFPLEQFRPLGNPTKFIGEILKHFSRLQDEDVSAQDYLKYAQSLDGKSEEYLEAKELAETYKVYSELKIKHSKLDFGDLIFLTLKLFRERPRILKKYHERFKYILVDEYQDTNYTQNVLVNMLALGKEQKNASKAERKNANVTVVGDDDQSIYKFRGAAISNILQFKEVYPEAKRVVLVDNYRSKQEILDAAYKLISHNNPYRLEITESVSKQLKQGREFKEGGSAVNVIFSNTSSGEADRVVKEITSLTKGKKYSYEDIAILVRAHSHSDDFVQALRFNGIPYKFGGARGLYTRSEVMVLISFLRVLADSSDEVSMFNLLSMPEFALEPREVVEILKYSKRLKIPTLEVIEGIVGRKAGTESGSTGKIDYLPSNSALTGLSLIVDIFDKGYRMMKDGRGVGEILFMFFEKSKYKDTVLSEETVENQIRVDNIRRYFDMIKEYERNNSRTTIYDYLGYLDYSLEIGENPSVDQSMLVDYNAVNIMTVHSAKGLEFPVVFLVNLVSERFPSRNMSDKIPIPEELIKEVVTEEKDTQQHLQEERRLFYVGATRAEEKLYLSAAGFYSEGKRKKRPSVFLNEILDRDVRKEFEDLKDDEAVQFAVHRSNDLDIVDMKSLGLKPQTRFSYSQISTYERCPREYKYRYVLGLPTPVSAAASFGVTIHAALKGYYEKIKAAKEGLEGFIELPKKEDLLALYDSYWISQGYDDKLHEKKRYEYGRKRLKDYVEKFDTESENPLELEKRFAYALEDVVVTGIIDRIDLAQEGGKKKVVEIIDYKTGKPKTEKEAAKEWQLALYAMAAEAQFGFTVPSGAYIYLEQNKKVRVEITQKKKEEVKNKVVSIARKIREGDFTVPSGHICNYCSFGDIGEDAIL